MGKWDGDNYIKNDGTVMMYDHNVRIGALIFFIWSVVMMMLGIGIGRYLI